MKYSIPSFDKNSKLLTSFIATVYMIIMFGIYPFYLKEGYVGAGSSKYRFFLYSSIGAVLLLLLTGLIELIKSFNQFSATDVFVMGFVAISLVSYFGSPFRMASFLGADGWFMGLLTILLMCMVYVLISRLWELEAIVFYVCLIAAAVVYIIGILDRFSLYIIPYAVRNPSFISTIGNINWFMGYFSVITPIGVGLFLYELKEGHSIRRKYLLLAFVFIAFMAGFAQGSESIFLFLAALYTGLLFLCFKDILNLSDVFLLVGMMGIVAQIIRIMRLLYPEGYNYQTDGPCAFFTGSNISLYIAVCALIIWQLLQRYSRLSRLNKSFIIVIWGLLVVAFFAFLIIGVLKTNTDIISGFDSSIFYFDERFGSDRGVAYKVSIGALRDMSIYQRLFGVGPDAFVEYVYSIPNLADYLTGIWPNQPLTNAHCEMLNMLINEGIAGLILYLGIFISFLICTIRESITKLAKSGNIGAVLKLCISLSIFCYLVHNLISFGQVMSTPYIFILMGICRAIDINN